jgi:hypothetical protein
VLPVPQPQTVIQNNEGHRDEMARFGARVDRVEARLGDWEGRLGGIEGLLRENDQAKYLEVRATQAEIYRKLEVVEKGQKGQDLTLLYLLCGGSLFLSLAALGKRSRKG